VEREAEAVGARPAGGRPLTEWRKSSQSCRTGERDRNGYRFKMAH
jgi:hypothetical protein